MVGEDDAEDKRLRAAALQNAQSILSVRQRAEHELLAAKEALERKTEELQQQREWLEVTLSSIGDAVITTDTLGRVTFLNPVAEKMTGWASADARGEPLERVFRIINEATGQAAENPVAAVLSGGVVGALANHMALIDRAGGVIAIEDSAAPIRDARGRITGAVMVFHDVTERRRAQAALRASDERLRATFNQAAVGIAVADPQGRFLEANQKFCDILGYSLAEVRELTAAQITHPQDLVETQDQVKRLLAGEIPHYILDKRYLSKSGEPVWSRTTVTLLRDSAGRAERFIGVIEDISDRKAAEAALREEIASRERAESALRETDRRKDEFLATLAHELRNPLAPIRQAALISTAPGATEAQKRWSHDVISRQVQHMALLLGDLLDISRITRGTLELRTEVTELAAVIDAAVETARPALDARRHSFTIETPPEPIHVAADPLRLAQVLSNLLTNAAKYTDPQGRIRLCVGCDADGVTISVTDSGIGIPRESLAGVFAMFSQVHSSRDRSEGGLGIGLALARGLVELHGGSIEAKSAGAGRGSEFIVRLPRGLLAVAARKRSADPGWVAVVRRRVLIADDNRDAAESLATLLRLEGHEVGVAYDGQQALATFRELRPEFALLDIGMPKLSGYEVARLVREGPLSRSVTLVAVTGWGQDSDKASALAAGFNHHLTKPVEFDRLSDLLRNGGEAPA